MSEEYMRGGASELPAYPAYREAKGLRWVDKIPQNWSIVKLKYLSEKKISSGVGEAGKFDRKDWPRYIRTTDIAGSRTLHEDTFRSLPPETARQASLEVGDLLLVSVGATFGQSYLHTEDIGPACYAGYLVRVSPSEEVDERFLAYWTKSFPYWAEVRSRVVQATVENFSARRYSELPVPVPPRSQQRKIADFLDNTVGTSDRLLGAVEELEGTVKEKDAATITRAVTKGVGRCGSVKEVGLEWVEEVPSHWEVVPVREVLQERQERNTGPKTDNVLSLVAERGVIPYEEKGNLGNKKSDDIEKYKIVYPGDFVLNSMNIGIGAFGVSSYKGATSPAYVIMIPNADGCVPGYVASLFQTPAFQQYLTSHGKGIMELRRAVRWSTIKSIKIPLPPIEEQRQIAEVLSRERARTERLEKGLSSTVETIREYRSALINAAVTGRCDVRVVSG